MKSYCGAGSQVGVCQSLIRGGEEEEDSKTTTSTTTLPSWRSKVPEASLQSYTTSIEKRKQDKEKTMSENGFPFLYVTLHVSGRGSSPVWGFPIIPYQGETSAAVKVVDELVILEFKEFGTFQGLRSPTTYRFVGPELIIQECNGSRILTFLLSQEGEGVARIALYRAFPFSAPPPSPETTTSVSAPSPSSSGYAADAEGGPNERDVGGGGCDSKSSGPQLTIQLEDSPSSGGCFCF